MTTWSHSFFRHTWKLSLAYVTEVRRKALKKYGLTRGLRILTAQPATPRSLPPEVVGHYASLHVSSRRDVYASSVATTFVWMTADNYWRLTPTFEVPKHFLMTASRLFSTFLKNILTSYLQNATALVLLTVHHSINTYATCRSTNSRMLLSNSSTIRRPRPDLGCCLL
jgi:hypothetical protein